jgi:hypothetical protein
MDDSQKKENRRFFLKLPISVVAVPSPESGACSGWCTARCGATCAEVCEGGDAAEFGKAVAADML